jgi:quercetin dioxygenase-like cupin family protein
MRKAGKVWGETSLIHANSALEFHRIEIEQDGYCSKHMHEFKWNGFYVESGHLVIKVWQDEYDLIDETTLGPGDFMQVKPGLYHSFHAAEDTIAFELYWAEFNHDDIVRESVGGLEKERVIRRGPMEPDNFTREQGEDAVSKVMNEKQSLASKLLALLDLIEIQNDAGLASGRFDILEEYGEVEFGAEVSGRKQ